MQVAHTDVTLDDMWSLDLVKLDGWRCVKENSQGEEAFLEEEGWETDEGGSSNNNTGGDAAGYAEAEESSDDEEG